MDVICQASSGMGKTAVFVLTTLQQLDLTQSGDVLVICLCHTRELAFQIQNEYDRFSKYMPEVITNAIHPLPPLCRCVRTEFARGTGQNRLLSQTRR